MELPEQSIRTYALAGVLALAVVGAIVWFFVLGSDEGEGAAAPPENWAAEVQELVGFVELRRGAAFVHPVAVDLVDHDEFAARLGADIDGVSEADHALLAQSVDVLRALGLITARTDDDTIIAEAAPLALVGDQSVRYLRNERRIIVAADDLGRLDTVTEIELVGALSEALHAQHFGLSNASPLDLSQTAVGPRAVAAGVGPVLIDEYVAGLTEREQEAWVAHNELPRDDDVEHVVANFVLLPEFLGEALMRLARADTVVDGSKPTWVAVSELLAAPPRTELELIQPWAGIDGFERVGVDVPVVDEGSEVISEGRFGAASLYYVMGMRIDPRQALGASLQWAGDAYVLSRDEDGRRCFDLALEGRDGDASDRYQTALEAWVAAGPRGADSSVDRDGRTVRFHSCEAATGASTGIALDPDTVVALAVNRSTLLAELRLQNMTRNRAVCIADRVIEAIPVSALEATEVPPEAQIIYSELLDNSRRACRNL